MKEKLVKYNQQHLLEYYDELGGAERAGLEDQVERIDFGLMDRLFRTVGEDHGEAGESRYEPMASVDLSQDGSRGHYEAVGVEAIQAGRLAVVLMAGGQGSRLGFDGPKGAFDIGLETGESLFELQALSLLEVKARTGTFVKWYVMTSDTNHEATVDFFEANNYFGYDRDSVTFFRQGMLPAVREDGKVILSGKGQISFSPNGNGGIYLALRDSGIMAEMREDGVEWIFIYGVDNALVKVAEPVFFGYTLESGHPIGSKIVKKAYAEEKVGVVCYKDGRPAIVEYSELGEEMNHALDTDGSLLYDNANIVNHLIKLDLIDALLEGEMAYHVAHKFVEGIDLDSEALTERKPNAYKFETFIFDIFQYCQGMAVVEVEREKEFAPVKNKSGKDSPESAVALVTKARSK